MTWEKAVEKFKIGKIYHNCSLKDVEKTSPGIAQDGRDWVRDPKPLYISGTPGSGKTYFCMALLKALLEVRKPEWVMFKRSEQMDSELLKAIQEGQEEFYLENYQNVPYLFIDDLGAERCNERIVKQYYNIINSRMENLMPTVFTSNVPVDGISNTLGDRIASRLQMATQIKFPKKDLRKTLTV